MDEKSAVHITAYICSSFLFLAIMVLNIVTILALRRTFALPRNFKTLLLSLAVSDAGVGLLVQPLYIAIHATLHMNIQVPNVARAYLVIMNTLCVTSFLGVAALAADRFLAIHVHLRYEELVTHNRVAVGVISMWVFSACISFPVLREAKITFLIITFVVIVCFLVTGVFYLKIYLAVKRQANQIITLNRPRGEENLEELALNARRQRKAATMTFGVYLVLMVCYLPSLYITAVKVISPANPPSQILLLISDLFIYLNACLNPLIYCWKMKPIRQSAVSIIRSTFSF